MFFSLVRIYGKDFDQLSKFFPDRNRIQVKQFWNNESKRTNLWDMMPMKRAIISDEEIAKKFKTRLFLDIDMDSA